MRSAIFATLLLCLAVSTAQAGPDRISVMLGTHHAGADIDYEEVNPGLFLTWSQLMWQNRLDLTVGGIRTSNGDFSLAVTPA